MKMAIIAAVCLIVGTTLGFGFMFWVAKEMVLKVRTEEEKKHQELLNLTADHAGQWMDVVNDILEAVQNGELSNKSVPQQVKIIRRIIAKKDEQTD